MDDFFFKIANIWSDSFASMYEGPLTHDMVEDSVSRACDFFHIVEPEIKSGEITSVVFNNPYTLSDDTQLYNLSELTQVGITGQDGLDLVMTHEGTHRMLQDIGAEFTTYQEELCCDYMSGVRAELDNINVTQLINSLIDRPQGTNHPLGVLRVNAIEEGMSFAHDFQKINDSSPNFDECLNDFNHSHMHDVAELSRLRAEMESKSHMMEHYQDQMERKPESQQAKQKFIDGKEAYERACESYQNKLQSMANRELSETVRKAGWNGGGLRETATDMGLKETTGSVGWTEGTASGFIHHPSSEIHHTSFGYTAQEIHNKLFQAELTIAREDANISRLNKIVSFKGKFSSSQEGLVQVASRKANR